MKLSTLFGFGCVAIFLCSSAAKASGSYCSEGIHSFAFTHARAFSVTPSKETSRLTEVGIKEIVPNELRNRYQKWKDELLSTDFGRKQWESYANNKEFLLKVVVSSDRKYGAGTDAFEWDDTGRLISATITLGKNLDKGFPDPVYYPVMNSLATFDGLYEISGDILASTKIIHELGHVEFTSQANGKAFQRENKLMASYNTIFLKNGYNTKDPQLVDLANELGAKPIEIWEAREYRSEAIALRYVIERMQHEPNYCSIFARVRRNISSYAREYRYSFEEVVGEASQSPCQN